MKSRLLLLVILFLMSCVNSVPRRPINQKPSTTIFQDHIEATKKIFQREENKIVEFIKKDSVHLYHSSSNGFWYTYVTKVESETVMPKTGDVVALTYNISDLNDSIIYDKAIFGVKKYKVDKENFISGIQKGIKLMKIGETIIFVFPSYNAFGISGDGNKIGINKTIKSTITLLSIN